MSERDLQRIEILSKVMAGRMSTVSAAHVLDLSERQVRRLLERIRTGGVASIRHKAIGRAISASHGCHIETGNRHALMKEAMASFAGDSHHNIVLALTIEDSILRPSSREGPTNLKRTRWRACHRQTYSTDAWRGTLVIFKQFRLRYFHLARMGARNKAPALKL